MILHWIKQTVREWLLHKRFPMSTIHSGVTADSTSKIKYHAVLFRNVALLNSTIERYSYIQANSSIYNTQIGPFCSIASNVTIGLASHPTHLVSTNPVFYDNTQPLPFFFTQSKQFDQILPRTIICADVWIGQGAMIKAGITVGVGAVIGTGAVVTKDVAPYSIVAGVPAREIKKRFDDITCQRLVDSKWWELDDPRLFQLAPLFSDPEKFLDTLDGNKL